MIESDVNKLMNRFDTLAYRTVRRQQVKPEPERPPVDPAVEEQDQMAEFARAPQTRKKLIPWLQAQQKLAAGGVRQTAMTGGASTQFAVGYEAALNDLLEKFEVWSQTTSDRDETRSMRPLEGVSQ